MVVFRPARPDEIETVRALERASAQRFVGLMDALAEDEPSPTEVLAARIRTGGLFVAADGETVAGFVMFRRVETYAYVEQIDVLPAFAGRRIGAALLDAVAERAKAAGLWVCRCRRSGACRGTRPTTAGWGSWMWRWTP